MSLMFILLASALGSQVHPRDVPLAEVVKQSPLIVIVKAAEPSTRAESLAVPGPKAVDPYTFDAQRLTVVEVVRDQAGVTKQGATLEVAHGNLGMNYSLHVRYYRDGVSKSPIVPIYKSPISFEKPQKTWIAMLRPCKVETWDGLCYAVSNARELTKNRKMVEALTN